MFVSMLRTLIRTPGRIAPFASVTVPVIVAYVVCARNEIGDAHTLTNTPNRQRSFRMGLPPVFVTCGPSSEVCGLFLSPHAQSLVETLEKSDSENPENRSVYCH